MSSQAENKLRQGILAQTERCVACGLCLPWCPTYKLHNLEFESPRGRLSLLQGLANSQLKPGLSTAELLDHCLLCRSCERHCPSSVAFGEAMDTGRQLLQQSLPASVISKLAINITDWILKNPNIINWIGLPAVALKTVLPSSLTRKAANSKSFRGLTYLPSLQWHTKWKNRYSSSHKKRGRVCLFLGCVARSLDTRSLDDGIALLNAQGYEVIVPPDQSCCGAMPQHRGRAKPAEQMMKKNQTTFSASGETEIIHMSTGCSVALSGHKGESDDTTRMGNRIREICAFLDEHWDEATPVKPSNRHVLIHTPCSSQDGLSVINLLKRIPGIRLDELSMTYGCCGSAGSYMLSQAETADALRTPLLDQIRNLRPDVVVTTNPGCALHISQGLRMEKPDIPVVHPVSILLEQVR